MGIKKIEKTTTIGEIFRSEELLPIEFNDWDKISDEISNLNSRKVALDSTNKSIAEEIKEVESITNRINKQIANKKIYKECDCYFLFDWNRGTKQKWAIKENGDHIDIVDGLLITESERQLRIAGIKPEDKAVIEEEFMPKEKVVVTQKALGDPIEASVRSELKHIPSLSSTPELKSELPVEERMRVKSE